MRRTVGCLAVGVLLGLSLAAESRPAAGRLNKVIDKLERGLLVTGLYISSLDPSNAIGLVNANGWQAGDEVYSKPAVDLLMIDQEHEPYDLEKLRTFLLALNSRREVFLKQNLQPNLMTLVVIPTRGDDPLNATVKQLLDLGIFGVMSTVDDAGQARRLVQTCRYPEAAGAPDFEPAGLRVAYPLWAAYLWGLTEREYYQRADLWPLDPQGELLVAVHIETRAGVENIDSILQVPGIAAAHFGPRDYSFSIGRPMETGHPQVQAGLQKVKEACARNKVHFIDWVDEGNVQQVIAEGTRILMVGTDTDNGFNDPQNWGHRGAGKMIDYLKQRGLR